MSENQTPTPQTIQIVPHQATQMPPIIDNEVPARVKLAADFVAFMTVQAQPFVMVNGITGGLESEPSAKRTTEAEAAYAGANTLLSDYFRGNEVQPDEWEMQRMDAMQTETSRRRPGEIILCGWCQAKGAMEANGQQVVCTHCMGSGRLWASPAR